MVKPVGAVATAVALLGLVTACGGRPVPAQGNEPASGQQPSVVQQPAAATPSQPDPAANPPKDAPTVDEQLKGYQILGQGTLAIPGVGESPMWFVQKKSPVIGVFVAIKGKVIPIHLPEPQNGMLAGPDINVPEVTVSDLDADGVKEIVIQGNAGMGPGIWVYQYDAKALKFVFHGNLYGEKGISAVVNPDGKMTFQASQVDWKSKDHPVTWTDWQWRPSGFFKVP